MLIPAKRLYFFLASLMIIPVGLQWWLSPQLILILMLGLNTILLAVAIGDGLRVKSDRLKISRSPLPRLSIGRDNPISVTVQSQQRAQLLISDGYPREFPVSTPQFTLNLQPNQTQYEVFYTIQPHTRGEYIWQDLQVRQLSPWGLMWKDWRVNSRDKGIVYPDLIGLRSLSIRLALEKTGTMRQARRLGRGTEFAELRNYRQGDDTRMIDWKATARSNVPVVKVLEPEQEQTLIILLDRGRLMTARVQGMKRFDWGLNATLSLALAGINRGDRVGVGVFDRQVATWIPPARGTQQMSLLIESLSSLQPVLLESDYAGIVSQLVTQQTRRALVVILTDWIDVTASTELLQTMMGLTPRYLPFCVALQDPVIEAIAHSDSIKLDEAYTQAVALDLLQERKLAASLLKQKGILVLDAPANRITTELVNRYLQLKDTGRI
ncbi:DUF58 domain-containing protein [Gloeocapsa sp. PCC 73106]|uniref:DUF58 domain-containing protein n=1 Tax=Gloeocapsa sp. PCC 73106 TaxID=102232 RepID=UPI0002AC8C87|nr:DUF58 domain-containing protein [Gloeocapsa sp. PCC 73106]ELR97811.1 hypothetical protein GLO73106DRAFT_00016280 [Gloeocapsa sp. PCC 73106]